MVVVAVKKYCSKNGKQYGPYPKNPEIFYLYRVQRRGDKVVSRYLGKGPRPADVMVREIRSVSDVHAAKYLEYLERLVAQESKNVVQETGETECSARKTVPVKRTKKAAEPLIDRNFSSVVQENVKPKQAGISPNSRKEP